MINIRSGPKRHKHFEGFLNVSVKHRHRTILSVLPRLDPSMAKLDFNSQPKDNPYAVRIDVVSSQLEQTKQKQDNSSDIEQQPPFGDRKYSDTLLQKRGEYKQHYYLLI